ncbi:MAG: DUF2520 domain-containing protein [Chloroflexota bacterium]|nr:DUF2520 domain-containing protein [Chloroflexota bacterium]MDE2942064.1 DUF2520 domain-containing protein [Chloroflexota bacterium]MDE3267288.1 DUF2520 domain-containing protein [Chloroflexota bacterium]
MISSDLRVGFIGAGRAAGALAAGLSERGYPVPAVASRTHASAAALAERIEGCKAVASAQRVAESCDIVFITTPDAAIESVAREVDWPAGVGVAHCCGAESASILDAARVQGAPTGSFHPMQTFTQATRGTDCFAGVTFAIDGSPPLLDVLAEMARALGGRPVEVRPEHRALYHLSGFLACGLMTAQVGRAADLWSVMGFTREQGLEALVPILRGTVDSLEAQGLPGALTGPISRGDLGTVRKHLEAIESYAPSLLPLYCESALGAITLAVEKGGIDGAAEAALRALLEERRASAERVEEVTARSGAGAPIVG